MDATGAQVLGDAVNRLERRGIVVLLSGITSGHDQVLATLGVADQLRSNGRIFPGTPAAIAHARQLLAHELGTHRDPLPTARPGQQGPQETAFQVSAPR